MLLCKHRFSCKLRCYGVISFSTLMPDKGLVSRGYFWGGGGGGGEGWGGCSAIRMNVHKLRNVLSHCILLCLP